MSKKNVQIWQFCDRQGGPQKQTYAYTGRTWKLYNERSGFWNPTWNFVMRWQLINEVLMDSAELITPFSDPLTCPGKSRVLPTAVRGVPDNIPTGSSLSPANDVLGSGSSSKLAKKSEWRLPHNPEIRGKSFLKNHKTKHYINLPIY